MCPRLAEGQCRQGDCKYAHNEKELRSTDNLYKTSMCIQYAKGKCQAGRHCRYAHHASERRKIESSLDGSFHSDESRVRKPVYSTHFDEDLKSRSPKTREFAQKSRVEDSNKGLRKVVHSSDYEDEAYRENDHHIGATEQHRYNYFNPFYFYSFANFPVYTPVTVNQTMPFYNYISINNSVAKSEEEPRRCRDRFAEDWSSERMARQAESFVKEDSRETARRRRV